MIWILWCHVRTGEEFWRLMVYPYCWKGMVQDHGNGPCYIIDQKVLGHDPTFILPGDVEYEEMLSTQGPS